MSAAGLPEVAEGGQHRRRASVLTGPRVGLTVLLLGIAAATVAVPPLVAPGSTASEPAAPPPPVLTPATPAPSSRPAVSSRPAPATVTAPAPCAPDSTDVGLQPSCTIYDGSVGNGWSITSAGLKVLPGELVPDTRERAMRVERSRPARPETEMALIAAKPVGITGRTRLALRIWGGRDHGTVLRVGVGGTAVTIVAPADRWTSRTVRLADLTPAATLTRIDLRVAADQVPNVGRFFLDDVTLSR